MTGANLTMMKTPALTMVEECNRAETGVGATMAPKSQELKGSWADLVSPAKQMSVAGSTATSRPVLPKATSESKAGARWFWAIKKRASAKPTPPMRFNPRAW